MILRSLLDFARRENLLDDPDFDGRGKVDFVLRIGRAGEFLSLEPVERGRHRVVPRQDPHNNGLSPLFMVDNARYVLGVGPESRAGRNALCADAFLGRVREVAAATGDEGARAVVLFLESHRDKVLGRRKASEWTGSEVLAFCYSPDETLLVHERTLVRDYWRVHHQAPAEGEPAACLVTGQVCVPVRLHGGIPLGGSSARLVSFNSDSFLSHGLGKGEIAPISREAAEGYAAALCHMLGPSEDGKRPHRQGLRIGETVLVFWTRDAHPIEDVLSLMLNPTSEVAAEMQDALYRRGREPQALDVTPFYGMLLSGNQARVIVRDWIELTAATVLSNLRRYFRDLHLGDGDEQPVALGTLLGALGAERGKPVYARTAAKIVQAALCGHPLPRQLLWDAAYQFWTAAQPKKTSLSDLRAREQMQCRIIKAVLARLPNPTEIPLSLDTNRSDLPYLLGRLFAVLENQQRAAAGPSLNASIRDRFNAAPKTPARVFPELLKLSWSHDSKARRGDLERSKAEILAGITEFPRRLSLEQQGTFMIGYYQQRQKLYEKRAEPATQAEPPKETE